MLKLYRIAPDGKGAFLRATMERTDSVSSLMLAAIVVRAAAYFCGIAITVVVAGVAGLFDPALPPGINWLGGIIAATVALCSKLQITFQD